MASSYPGSVVGASAVTYGPLPDHGYKQSQVSLVLHTTETSGMPGYTDMAFAPQYTYCLKTRVWTKHAEMDRRVGTLKGHTTACHGNCQAINVEIKGYSAQFNPSTGAAQHPWVGSDMTDENYQDLADFFRWTREDHGVANKVTPTPAGGWLYGTTSKHRMTCAEWDAFSGLTCHAAIPENTHWDVGVLDLQRVYDLSQDTPGEPPDDDLYRGVANVPDADWARNVVDRMLCLGIITSTDGFNWEKDLKDGTIWNYLYSFTDAITKGKVENC